MGFPGFERPVERRREGSEAPDRMREMHERMRNFQESMRRFQEQMREWQKNPSGEMPKMPELPEPARERSGGDSPGRPGGQLGVHPADLLRDMRPGSGPGAPGEWSDGSSRWDAGRARVKMRDNDGELEVTMKEGKRVLTIKSPQGELIFTGPVDSPEERAAIPEQFRGKLSMMAPPPPRNDQRERPPMLPPTRLPSERGPGFQ